MQRVYKIDPNLTNTAKRGGGVVGVLPYVTYTGMCRWTGYGFWPFCPEQGI